MDIHQHNFQAKLLEILTAIAESHFVSFDLELSGVPVRPYSLRDSGKQTLQQRYTEVRLAAQKYTILQVGLTCVKEDVATATYELKPFNIDLSPILCERLDIDRDFSFHSGAVDFLNSVGFDYQRPLAVGAPYLSRDEATLALTRAEERLSRTNAFYEPMIIKSDETEALALQQKVRKLVRDWLRRPDNSEAKPLSLGPDELSTAIPPPEELSRYEKRLVHQIVRSDFENLVTFPRRGAIQVQHIDQEKEDAVKRQKLRDIKARISRQTGFRWVIEAIAGRSFRDLDWQSLVEINQDGTVRPPTLDTQLRFQRCQHHLDRRPRTVIGHNMFLDLVYLYQTFIGDLPEAVEDFTHKVNDLFPLIMDTKYAATHECGDINPTSSLQQIAEQLDQQEKPTIRVHKHFTKYDDYVAHHEAGYDSMLTAKVAVRLSVKLETDRKVANTSDNITPRSSEDDDPGGIALGSGLGSKSAMSSVFGTAKSRIVVPVAEAVTKSRAPQDQQRMLPVCRFAHPTAFDGLQPDENTDTNASEEPVLQFDDLSGSPKSDDHGDDWGSSATDPELHDLCSKRKAKQQDEPLSLMPRWTAEFWNEYGNRLRVFGTQESMCVLSPGPEASANAERRKNEEQKPVQW